MFGKGDSLNTYYYGSDTYKRIEPLIEDASEVLIVSPYIDAYYARWLLDKSRGKKLYVISSSMDEEAVKLLSDKSIIWILSYLALSMAIFGLLIFISVPKSILLLALIPITVGIVKNAGKGSGIKLKVPRRFVHAKIYISDTTAITGSANLTYKGTHKNLEQINITKNTDSIERLRKQFWEMWSIEPGKN